MKSEESIDLPFSSSPIIKIGVALFDILSGIKVDYQWNFSESYLLDQTEMNIKDLFKISLTSSHRQNDKYYQNYVISKCEFPQDGIFMLSSIFMANAKKKNTHYSLAIVMKASEIKNNVYFYSFLSTKIRSLTTIVKNSIQESNQYSSVTPVIKSYSIDISKVIFSMNKIKFNETIKSNSDEKPHPTSNSESSPLIKASKSISRKMNLCENFNLAIENDTPCDFCEIEFSFLAIALTSHIQTQMTTIVECQNIKMAHSIATFLNQFLLPGQREMSSFEIREAPVSGLFLQFVHQQKTLKNRTIKSINRPTTWIRISDQSVDQIINNEQVSIKKPVPWACKTVQLVQQSARSMQKIICNIQMKDILWLASSYSILYQSRSQTQTQMMRPSARIFGDKSPAISFNVLDSNCLSNEEDFKLVESLAQLFYPDLLFSKNT